MSEQCGLGIGSEMTSLNLHINGIVLKESSTVICGITHLIIQHLSFTKKKNIYSTRIQSFSKLVNDG